MLHYSNLPFDIIHHICSILGAEDKETLRVLSLVDRQTRLATIPSLFNQIIFDRQWGAEGPAWEGVATTIEALLKNEAIIMAIRSFHFQPWVGNPEKRPIPNEVFQFLLALPQLRELAVVLQIEYLTQVQVAFNAVEDTLPRLECKSLPAVRSLTIASTEWMFLGECCPNLTFLELNGPSAGRWMHQEPDIDIIRLGKVHPKLTGLLCAEPGLTKIIQAIATNLPQLKDLGLYGGFPYEESALDNLGAFKDFKHLESLYFPDASDWGMGFCPPRCGNAYFSNPGLQDLIQKEEKDTTQRLMDGIYIKITSEKRTTLRQVIIGPRYWHLQIVWQRGDDGRFFESKEIERCRRTRKVRKVTKVE